MVKQKLHSHGKSLKRGQFISSEPSFLLLNLEEGTYTADYDRVGSVTVKVID